MARPQVADEGDDLQVWRVAVKISINQSRTAKKGRFSSFEFGRGSKTPHHK